MIVGLLKRFAPFFITFALGLFIASFFVSVAAPNFQFRRQRMMRQCREVENLRYENQRLREELRNQQMKSVEIRVVQDTFDDIVPPPAPIALKKVR